MHVAIYVRNIPEPASGASKDFMAFGGGLRLCVGAHFAKLQMAVFLHCLVTSPGKFFTPIRFILH